MKLLSSLSIFLLFNSYQAVEIKCEFSSKFLWFTSYGCNVQSIKTNFKRTMVTSIIDANHQQSTSSPESTRPSYPEEPWYTSTPGSPSTTSPDYSAVIRFSRFGGHFDFIPRGLMNFFPNLSEILIFYTSLQEITKNDFREFGSNLQKVYLGSNRISVINHDLFEFNPNLKELSLRNNLIVKVGMNLLENLTALWFLNFELNKCVDDYANTKEDVKKLARKIYESCYFYDSTSYSPCYPNGAGVPAVCLKN